MPEGGLRLQDGRGGGCHFSCCLAEYTGEGCSQEVGVDFTDTMVMGDMVRGLADLEVKTIVL